MEKQFVILYTHQKQKKAKTWHDGVLKHSGTGTKAVLYDEKGCRLDSIHMKVEDIKLGEQLESDRYYILVEEVKAEGSNAQTETISNQLESVQNTTQPSIPRARCPGLKRKKSGFMPPRLVKQVCLENSPNNEVLSGVPSADTSIAPLYHSNAGTRVPFLPHQSHNIGNSNVQITENDSEKNTLFQNKSADNSHRNVFNLYSRYSKLDNTSGSNNSSQELSSNGGNQKLLSPWSVYGSKNSSPSLNIGDSLSRSMFGSQGSDCSAYSYEDKDSNKLLDKFVDDKVGKSFITETTETKQTNPLHGMNCSSNKPQFCNDILHPKEAPYKMGEGCSVMNNEETGQGKRNISQIMNLLKKKPLGENNLESSLTHSVKVVEEQPVTKNKFRDTTRDVKLSNILVDKSKNVIEQKDHQQKFKSKNSLNEVKADNEVQHISDEIHLCSDKVAEISNVVSGDNIKSNKDIQNQDPEKQTLCLGGQSLLEENEESDNDDELMGSFHINFSPLSHVTNTDDENEVNDCTSKEQNDIDIDCDSGQIEEKYEENVTDKVDSVDYDGCATNENDGDSLEHCNDYILCDTGDSKNGQNRNMNANTASICNVLRKPNINKESPVIDTGTENCVLKGLEKTKDILHDMDMENNVLEHDEEKQNIVSERKVEKGVNGIDTNCSENFDTFEEGTDFIKTDVNSLDTFVSNECDMKENSDKDTFQAKVIKSKLDNLSDNVRVSLDAGKQVLDNNNDNFEGDNIMKDICDNDCNGADIVDDAELADQSVDNNASQYSRTTSQDTMDFSCDTLDSDDPNYHGIQTQHLGRLIPSSGFSKGLTVDDIQKGNKPQNRLNTTTYNENMNCSPAHTVNSMSMYGNKIGNSGTSSGAFHQHKEPMAVSNVNNALRCQNSNQFDRRKNSWSDSRNISPDTVKLTAPSLITGVEDLDSEDPLGNTHDVPAPPHPSKLIQRHVKRKADVCDTLQNRQSEEINKLNHDAHSMDSHFGGYGTHGISSAVVSRQHLNHPEDRACSSQYNAVYHTPGESPSLNEDLNQYRSPFQQLSDSDLSFQSSPNFYIDWQNNKPQICQQGKVCDAESTIDVNEAPVDASTRGMTERSSPLITDEDEIYGKLYKPRMMYQHQSGKIHYEPSNLSEFREESSPALIQEENMSSLLSKCKHKDLPDSVNSSLDSFPYQHYETLKEGSKANKSPNWQQHSTTTNPPHSQLSDSCDGYLFQGQRKKLPASLETAKDGNSLTVSEDSMKHTPNGNDVLNSKWQNFVASQTSDDCDIVMNKLTKTVDTTKKGRKDFVSLKSSPGLYNTQKAFFQPITDIEEDKKSHQQSLVSGLNSQLSDFSDDIYEREVSNCQKEDLRLNVTNSEHIPKNIDNNIQAVHKKSQDIAQTNDGKLNVVDMDKEIQEEFDSEMFSSMDSIADDDFYIEHFTESAKNKNLEIEVGEQEVPEIKENNLGDENLTSGKQVSDSSNVYNKKETETEGEVNGEVVGHPGSNITSFDDREREVTAVECLPKEDELCTELGCEEEDLEKENEDMEKTNAISEASEKVKYVNSYGSEKKIFSENTIGKGKDLHNLEECNVNKITMVTENTTKEETNCSSPGFSLDESLDLSFSLDIACATSTQPDRQISKTPAMRIGWRPPIKSGGSQKSPNQSDAHAGTVPQHSDAKKSEKLRPTFKCLRLITQKKNSIGAEQKSNNFEDIFDNVTGKKCELYKPDQSPNILSDDKQKFDPVEKNLSTTVRNSIDKETKNTTYQQQKRQAVNVPNNVSSNKSFKPPSMLRTPVVNRKIPSPCLPVTGQQVLGVSQTELRFPGRLETDRLQNVLRQVVIPDTFPTVAIYKQVLTAALTEYINTQLLDVAKRYHHALLKVDTTGYSEYKTKNNTGASNNPNPHCQCGVPSKIISVKKDGPNCGRYFYTCSANRNQQCKFFQWADEMRKGGGMSGNKRKIQDSQSLRLYMKDQHVHFYGECQLIKRTKENINRYFKAPKWARNRGDGDMVQKKQIFLKLPYKGRSSLYAKDDIWVISKHLDFDPVQSFLARSTYYGPSSSLEVEIEPLALYSPSNWQHEVVCHAILVGNLSSELSCMDNIRDHIQTQSPPVLSHLINRQTVDTTDSIRNSSRGFQAPRIVGDQVNRSGKNLHICSEQMDDLCRQYIERYSLNRDQAEAMRRVANMFSVEKSAIVDSVLLIHGVFGAGKSFLLSVMVLFLVEVFHLNDSLTDGQPFPWKLLISSTTNVAVDRILMGLLDLGFEDFVRVGSVKKIAKPVLPYSVHASGTDNQELKDLQEMLRSGELTATEKSHVRQSIEKHRHGENKKKLGRVRVVGATCASCSLACLNNMEFPVSYS
ncbi:uncharacterized protein LOC132733052 [Ruditapes philippinarum]|uniref:uncharacterized protein LOC132733052 n=1 Tax=Ruditapes philippinarum TaxID=129788 RepID=UPI00295BB210|nr:uncharacterized protein LOC132733052 [Ruditapes philippinarum]